MFSLFTSAFLLGIIANLHCVGMCGPIALALPLNRSSKVEIIVGILQYNFGRILTYSILGYIVGFIGLGIHLIGILQWVSITAGIGIIVYAWRKHLFQGILFQHLRFNFIQKFTSKKMGHILRNNHPLKLFLFGMLNGLLPCGMVYTALLISIVTGNPIYSSFSLFFFGLGTLPGMLLISFFAQKITTRFRGKINKMLPFFVTIIGLLIVLRGLNLNIPYLSPKTETQKNSLDIKIIPCHSTMMFGNPYSNNNLRFCVNS